MYKKIFKRWLDFALALLTILVLLPVFIPIVIILLITGEHEVFYLQTRIGYKNQKFKIWKFTTMVKNSPNIGTGSLTVRNDPRVLPVGRFLRKTKLNEFPQLINVLIGNMSIVGTRPYMEIDFVKYPAELQEQIYATPPGVTGIASIVFRDDERLVSEAPGDKHEFYHHQIVPYKGQLEIWYQRRISFRTDVLLILLTAWVILFPKSKLMYNVFPDLPARPDNLNL